MIYFIAGSSGSGKTSCMPYLKELLPDMLMHDFDEIGVPSDPTKSWRQETTEIWLKKFLNHDYKDACLFGQIVLGEILACPSAPKLGSIHHFLLDCSDMARIQRLRKRGTLPTQQALNWASWLRVHQTDPQWYQSTIRDHSWKGLDFTRWDQLQSWKGLASCHLIDTTSLSLSDVAAELAKRIRKASVKSHNL